MTPEQQQAIALANARRRQAEQATPQQETSLLSKFSSGLTGAADTATFGFGDEMRAAIQAPIYAMRGVENPYDYARQQYLQKQEEQKTLNPKSYLVGQIGGAVIPSLLPAGATVKGATTLGKYRRGAIAGAGAGGLYGVGTGDGDVGQRTIEAWDEASIGALGGVGGVALGKALSATGRATPEFIKRPTRALVERTKALYKPKERLLSVSPDEKAMMQASKKGDELFSKSVGQRTQSPKAQRLEAEALAGVYGDDVERIAKTAQIAQSRERKEFISQLGDIDSLGDPSDLVENVVGTIQKQAKSLKGEIDNAYDLARQGGGAKISTDDIKDGLFVKIGNVKREGQYDLGLMPQATARVKDLSKLIRKTQGGRFTSANLSSMENWRKRVTNGISSTQDKTEKRFLGEMRNSYDEFMYKTANEAVDQADSDAILVFRDAVKKRREYGRLYESDKFVQELVEGEKGIDDAVKDLLGTGSIVGKKRMESTYDAIIKAAGKEKDLVRADLQAGFAKKLLQQSTEGLEAGSLENAYLSASKTQKALSGLFENNRKFAEKLYGKENVFAAQRAIKELEPIARTQASTQNPSGSGFAVLRVMNNIPLVNIASKSFETAGKSIKGGKAVKSFGEIIKDMPVNPQSQLFNPKSTGLAATVYTGEE